MRRLIVALASSSLGLLSASCGDEAPTSADSAAPDVAAEDTTAGDLPPDDTTLPDSGSEDITALDTTPGDGDETDTSSDDSSEPDTVADDTSEPDTSSDDTSEPDTSSEDVTTPSRCACDGGSSCIEGREPDACPLVVSTCSGGMSIADTCDDTDAMATCVREATTQTWDYAQISGWLTSARTACSSGVFTVTPIPEGDGAVCSCQRSAGACIQTYGSACDGFACDAGLQASACPDTGRRPERCVTRDGQREIVYYASAGISATQAETTCLGASAVAYYWYPAAD